MTLVSRLASLVVAAALVANGVRQAGHLESVFGYVLIVAAPLALIWFPEVLGDYLGPTRGFHIDRPTPAWLIAAAGWFFLAGIPIVAWVLETR